MLLSRARSLALLSAGALAGSLLLLPASPAAADEATYEGFQENDGGVSTNPGPQTVCGTEVDVPILANYDFVAAAASGRPDTDTSIGVSVSPDFEGFAILVWFNAAFPVDLETDECEVIDLVPGQTLTRARDLGPQPPNGTTSSAAWMLQILLISVEEETGAYQLDFTSDDDHQLQVADENTQFDFDPISPGFTAQPEDVTEEATGPAGAVVSYPTPDAIDQTYVGEGEPVDATCSPASGTTFPLGLTNVECEAEDAYGNIQITDFDVTVEDTTAPTISVPNDPTVPATGPGGAVVGYNATANDLVDGGVTPQCTPAPGTQFPLGTTEVTCSATDEAGNEATEFFTVTVTDQAGPVIDLTDVTAEATGPDGAEVDFDTTVTDAVDGDVEAECTPSPGSDFPLGTTTVSCSATDQAGNTGTGSFDVLVQDTEAPSMGVPADIEVPADSADGAVVEFETTSVDAVDPDPEVTCLPASGSLFPEGVTEVSCTAVDDAGNDNESDFRITVGPARDTDEDGVPDWQEEEQGTDPDSPDTDEDGLDDGEEGVGPDSCAVDGLPDALEPDTDGDGLDDGVEALGFRVKQTVRTKGGTDPIGRVFTDPCARDTDADGASDRKEKAGTVVRQQVRTPFAGKRRYYTIGKVFTDPSVADTDGDGLSDAAELAGKRFKGKLIRTSPVNFDTDFGGIRDGREVQDGSNPADASSGPRHPREGHRTQG